MHKIAFIFPGQGSHYVGMGKTLCDKFSVARETFKEANEVMGFDLKKMCFEGPFSDLSKTENTQPAILTSSIAAYQVFKQEISIKADYLVGHSFGELSALVCAEAIAFKDAVKIAKFKGQLIREEVKRINSAMTAVNGIEENRIRKICNDVSGDRGKVVIGIINSPKQIVISGDEESVLKAEKLLEKQGGSLERLAVSAPFHSPYLKNAVSKAKKELLKYKFQKPKIPVLSSLSVELYQNANDIVNNLSSHLAEPIRWSDAIRYLVKNKVIDGIEIGPKAVLKKITEETTDKIEMHSFISPKDLEPLKNELKLDKASKFDVIVACLRIVASTKNSNFNNDEFNKGVSEPYRKIKNMLLKLREKEAEPTISNVAEALKMLRTALKTKKLEIKDQNEWFREISDSNKTLLHIPEIKEIFDSIDMNF